jgi:hypothetical protein
VDTPDDNPVRYPGNSCPYLRATNNPANAPHLGGQALPYGRAPLRQVYTNARAVGLGRVFSLGLASFAWCVDSLRPRVLVRNLVTRSFDSSGLADGPFDAPNRGTGVLKVDGYGRFSRTAFERTFVAHAKPRTNAATGAVEPGLDRAGIRSMLAAERAQRGGSRFAGFTVFAQFLVALMVFGRRDADGTRYLAIADMLAMYRDLDLSWIRRG